MGLPFENYDPVGRYRTSERWTDPATSITYDTPIDASGAVTGVSGTAQNAVELVKLLATSPDIESCFASHWMRFAYGRSLAERRRLQPADDRNRVHERGYNVKSLLLALTQSDGFLYRPVD